MERVFGQFMPRARVLAVATVGGAVLLAGCGSDNSYKNKLRPPEPINVTANVSDKRVSVSPTGFGAGPIVLIITNQTARNQDVTLETSALNETAGIKQSTGPIVPQGGVERQGCSSSFCELPRGLPTAIFAGVMESSATLSR